MMNLSNLNQGDWVALYNEDDHTFLKVARIEHKFTLTGKSAKTYHKNFVEVLMIRHLDKDSTIFESGSIKCDYITVDAETGKELDGKHHNLIIESIPLCKNLIFNDTGMSWAEMIDRQKYIYMFSDIDWKTMSMKELNEVYNVLFAASLRRDNENRG